MEHNGDIKKVLYLIEQNGFTDIIDDESVKPFIETPSYDIDGLKQLKYKIDSYELLDGSKEFRQGVMYGLQLSSIMVENLITKLEEKNEKY